MEFKFKPFKKELEEKMGKSIESIQSQLNTLRAGQANPAILDRVMVDYFGSMTPLNQVARIGTSGAQQIVVEPFDKSLIPVIDKAIMMAELNLNPTNDGSGVIRIAIPPLTEDRRKDLAKQAKTIGEDGKVAIRNIRRDAVETIKKTEKSTEISKDNSKEYQDGIQKSTDSFVKKIDEMIKKKEKDLLTDK
eukprot:CAMPEP_0182427914 /NCGR_PEP_ID=MMETSP1167-20130531/20817_1 /TAXON_ID=2988 /ORGANISM="Mallomonas Sp, Strain CCMP3275" /LENGTH=190 /DNA_ID=CAMNT_0024610497 /DNA_START=214 /DNA_END=784 /DNA_ORIENTATION=+